MLITKNIVLVCNVHQRGFVVGRSTYNTRIEYFWREHNVDVIIHFRDMIERLESLGHMHTDDKTDL